MTDNWDFYLTKIDHKISSIMVDLSIKAHTPISSHPHMGFIRLYLLHPNEEGLSSDQEFESLCEIGDALEAKAKLSNHIFVGRKTGNGTRDFYFYTENVERFRKDLTNVMNAYSNYEYGIDVREDLNWSLYNDLLYPDIYAYQSIQNRHLCEALERNGDNIEIPRSIDHRAYFKNKKQSLEFQNLITSENFDIINSGRVKALRGDYFVDFKRDDIPLQMDGVVYLILDKTEPLHAVYDGWGCTIVPHTS